MLAACSADVVGEQRLARVRVDGHPEDPRHPRRGAAPRRSTPRPARRSASGGRPTCLYVLYGLLGSLLSAVRQPCPGLAEAVGGRRSRSRSGMLPREAVLDAAGHLVAVLVAACASRSTIDALMSTVSHWSCGTPLAGEVGDGLLRSSAPSTLAAVASGCTSYVAGNSQPSTLPPASAGSPIDAGSAIAALSSSTGISVFSLILVSDLVLGEALGDGRPGTRPGSPGRAARRSRRRPSSRAACCTCPAGSRRRRGFSANASLNALALATTPASTSVVAISAPVWPGLITTVDGAVPGPG